MPTRSFTTPKSERLANMVFTRIGRYGTEPPDRALQRTGLRPAAERDNVEQTKW